MDTLLDTAGAVAAVRPGDNLHQTARRFMRLPGLRLVTTSVIVGEIYTYLVKLDGFGVARTTVRNLSSSSVVTIYQVDAGFDRDIWAAIDEFAGVPLSYADASLVVLGGRLRVRSVFSFDDDLRQAGLDLIPSA